MFAWRLLATRASFDFSSSTLENKGIDLSGSYRHHQRNNSRERSNDLMGFYADVKVNSYATTPCRCTHP